VVWLVYSTSCARRDNQPNSTEKKKSTIKILLYGKVALAPVSTFLGGGSEGQATIFSSINFDHHHHIFEKGY
jgi:hypothetical protein